MLLLVTLNGRAQNSDQVLLSESCGFGGRKAVLGPGIYRAYQLGIRDNTLSSIVVPKGMAIQVFEGDRYSGRQQTFYSSVFCLPSTWNDKVSSIKIYRRDDPSNQNGNNEETDRPAQGNSVIFYANRLYSGASILTRPGNFSTAAFGPVSGTISSIYVPQGHSVEVQDSRGNKRTFTSSVADLSLLGWDNKIVSGFIDNNFSGGNGGDGNTSGYNIPPSGNRVIVYTDTRYQGYGKVLEDGVISASQLGASLSSRISSIYIPSGKTFRARDRNQKTQNFYNSISDLRPYGWDNRITYAIVSGESSGGGGGGGNQGDDNLIVLYSGYNFSGDQVRISDGRIAYLGPNMDGKVSSISLPPGVQLVVFSERDMKGQYRTITSSTRNLNSIGWNDRIKSVFVIEQ